MAESAACRRLHGKVAVVTAATAGIGLGIAERLASEGARVMICSRCVGQPGTSSTVVVRLPTRPVSGPDPHRRQQNVDETVEALRAKGLQVSGVVCHVGNAQQRAHLIKQTMQEFGQLDILISNAAVSPTAHAVGCAALVLERSRHLTGCCLCCLRTGQPHGWPVGVHAPRCDRQNPRHQRQGSTAAGAGGAAAHEAGRPHCAHQQRDGLPVSGAALFGACSGSARAQPAHLAQLLLRIQPSIP